MKRRKRKSKSTFVWLVILSITLVLCFIVSIRFSTTHFDSGTIINGVDCSYLDIETAAKKLTSKLNSEVVFLFNDATYCKIPTEELNMQLSDVACLQDILEKQNNDNKRKIYMLHNAFSIDEDALKSYLKDFPNLKEENMIEPQNAYLKFDSNNLLTIIPEVVGKKIDFNEAYELALNTLSDGDTIIDFSVIDSIVMPEIVATNKSLIDQKEKINSFLQSSIDFILPDNSTITLDINTTKDWIYQDENGIFDIDFDSNINTFLDILSEKVSESNSCVEFIATDLGSINLTVVQSKRAKIDFETETNQIKQELTSSRSITRYPIYAQEVFTLDNQNYVEIDLTRQMVWMYINGNCIVSTPCVTGNASKGYSTPTGIFTLTYKTKNTYLQGYNDNGTRYRSHVNFWMPFNGNIGLHDASWRNKFGNNIYKNNGSHGCINLPYSAAETIYNNISKNMPIIVYES